MVDTTQRPETFSQLLVRLAFVGYGVEVDLVRGVADRADEYVIIP